MGDPTSFTFPLCRYERPLICYPGQEASFAGKHHNVQLALASIDRLAIAPGETFSFWSCVGRPTKRCGYQPAAALKHEVLTEDIGGAICLVSTLLYNTGLLSGATLLERWCHSVDSYSDRRYFELGRDAAVEYAYRDLRFRNELSVPIMLRAILEDSRVVAEAWSPEPLPLSVEICVEAFGSQGSVRASTHRTVVLDGRRREEDLGWSVHVVPEPVPALP